MQYLIIVLFGIILSGCGPSPIDRAAINAEKAAVIAKANKDAYYQKILKDSAALGKTKLTTPPSE